MFEIKPPWVKDWVDVINPQMTEEFFRDRCGFELFLDGSGCSSTVPVVKIPYYLIRLIASHYKIIDLPKINGDKYDIVINIPRYRITESVLEMCKRSKFGFYCAGGKNNPTQSIGFVSIELLIDKVLGMMGKPVLNRTVNDSIGDFIPLNCGE